MTDSQLEVLFRTFWSQAGYSAAPPGTHALMTHIAWARFLLQEAARQGHPAGSGEVLPEP